MASPQMWAHSYADAVKSMDVPRVIALASKHVSLIYNNNTPQITVERSQFGKQLDEAYGKLKATSKSIAATDYSIIQLSDDFAIIRFTWGVRQIETAQIIHTVNSSYLLRLEESEWRFFGILEQGTPNAPKSMEQG